MRQTQRSAVQRRRNRANRMDGRDCSCKVDPAGHGEEKSRKFFVSGFLFRTVMAAGARQAFDQGKPDGEDGKGRFGPDR